MKASCQCGQLTASAPEGAQATVVLCHCRDCRKRSGAPFGAMAYYPAEAVVFHGPMRDFTRPTDSGNSYTTGFCPTCGTSLKGQASRLPQIAGVALGCIDEGTIPAPTRSVYEQDKAEWIDLMGDMAHHPRGRDS
ncbi:GFA family protein [Alteraurantiacibacter buctensis]|uniref:Aldehyde-activating protein n=1 Tax=Alteraurantiacibacter buctensis TaxID=1503981 RepID=A0A844YX26_9SPHN|nr:GFA family protein [Alteraurantiacibacter buctensis]MXO71520.1 aldehyde-activating protein [Alteraurantiacibacter buctensis]